jgi:hypothetical protein
MKMKLMHKIVMLVGAILFAALPLNGQTPAANSPAELGPIAFLTAH